MANTYTQIHIQFVLVVKYRKGLLHSSFKDELYQYITGIIKYHNHKVLAINGVADHIHILIGMRPTQSISDLLQDVKRSSSKWINEKKFLKVKFEWQEGYGAFSYSKSDLNNVIKYIRNQEQHHAVKTFREEYLEFLKLFEVDYDERYIFKEPI
ncbi:IS200/IS605 family transposase [Flavobacterium paronense]|uniref:IS200/IS605 family transposase n=1 Tax=Flavobacterium paronense TaxID=1392775 RepID=A0ABV5GE92_9FLAO|nr:IS200/IS605 family transposase [Flavobacterium paronense]MDN3678230.1 IS200/IS605 family transposase [Flavobacterium paronense]